MKKETIAKVIELVEKEKEIIEILNAFSRNPANNNDVYIRREGFTLPHNGVIVDSIDLKLPKEMLDILLGLMKSMHADIRKELEAL